MSETVLNLPEYQFWYDAVIKDDADTVDRTLKSFERFLDKCYDSALKVENDERTFTHKLLNGIFSFPEFSPAQRFAFQGKTRRLTRPLTLAVAYGAINVVDVLISHGADVFAQEINGNNILHCLVYVASQRKDDGDEIIHIYECLRGNLSASDHRALLMMENTVDKLRPLEYAACCGTLKLMFAFWDTPDVYVVREQNVGVSTYQWYDITEYETLDDSASCRYNRSPLYLIGELDRHHLTTQYARDMFSGDTLIADWMQRAADTNMYMLHSQFLIRLIFITVFYLYDTDQFWLQQIGGVSSSDVGVSNTFDSNDTEQFIFCSGTTVNFLSNSALRKFVLAYLVFQAIVVLAYHSFALLHDLTKNYSRFTRIARSEFGSSHSRYAHMTFELIVFVQITLLAFVEERGGPGTQAIDFFRFMTTATSLFSLMYFLEMYPRIGHLFIYIRKTAGDLALFVWMIFDVVLVFSRLEMLYVNTHSLSGCTPEFSNLFQSIYTLFLTFLKMQNYKKFDVQNIGLLYLQQMIFVFIVGLMLANILIAIAIDAVRKVYRDKDIMTAIARQFFTGEVNYIYCKIPFLGRMYFKKRYNRRVRRFFVNENDRIYLVRIKNNNSRLPARRKTVRLPRVMLI